MKRICVVLAVCLPAVGCDEKETKSDQPEAKSDEGKPEEPKEATPSEEDDGAPAKDEPPALADLDPEPERLDIKVNLPPSPDFDESASPSKHADGSLSIAGLRADIEGNAANGDKGVEVTLTATVQEIYFPPMCPADEVCPPGKQPHLWLVDKPDDKGKRNALLVAGFTFAIPEWDAKRWEGQPEIVMEVGKSYTLKGKFRLATDAGFMNDKGVFEFVALKDGTGWVYPPGAPWHPIEIARQEEAKAAAAKKEAER